MEPGSFRFLNTRPPRSSHLRSGVFQNFLWIWKGRYPMPIKARPRPNGQEIPRPRLVRSCPQRPDAFHARPQKQAVTGEPSEKKSPVVVRAATSSGSFGSIYVLTSQGALLWERSEPLRGGYHQQLRLARADELRVDALGALVRHAERAASEFGVFAPPKEGKRAA